MARLGPFETRPKLAVAASGGADSSALAVLSQRWAQARGGTVTALIVDHGLRPESGAEALVTSARLQRLGLPSEILTLHDLRAGPGLAARARAARHAALRDACAAAGILHLLLGHHAADQAETRMMRLLRGSLADGLAGMAALVETPAVRLLRPLLAAAPGDLRATARAAGLAWVEDPSNRDLAMLRPRLRRALADPDGHGATVAWHTAQAAALGRARAEREAEDASWFGRHVRLHPEGFAVLLALPPRPAMLARIVQNVSGSRYPPSVRAAARWLREPRPATLGGAVLRPAGRLAAGTAWLAAREIAAIKPPAEAWRDGVWDGRLRARPACGKDTGVKGRASARPRAVSWPAAIHASLPDTPPPRMPAGAPPALCWWPKTPLAGGEFVPALDSPLDGDAQL